MADMTEKEVNLHRGLLKEKKAKKSKKFRSSTLPFNQSVMHTDLVPEQLDWRDYGTETNILDHFQPFLPNRLTISKGRGTSRALMGSNGEGLVPLYLLGWSAFTSSQLFQSLNSPFFPPYRG